jgi:hypothetical protein
MEGHQGSELKSIKNNGEMDLFYCPLRSLS